MRSGLDVRLYERTVHPYADAVIELFYVHAYLLELLCYGLEVLGDNVLDDSIALCSGDSHHKCTRLYLVGDNGIGSAVEVLNASYLDDVGTCAHDVGAHGVEEVCKVDDMRLLGGILDNSKTLSLYSRKHSIHRSSDSNDIEEYLSAPELVCSEVDHALTERILSTESRKRLEVLVYGTVTEGTSSRHGHARLIVPAEQSTEEVVGSAHLSRVLIGHAYLVYGSGVNAVSVGANSLDARAHLLEYL